MSILLSYTISIDNDDNVEHTASATIAVTPHIQSSNDGEIILKAVGTSDDVKDDLNAALNFLRDDVNKATNLAGDL